MLRPNLCDVSEPFVLAIDQGTSSTKAIAVDSDGAVLARGGAPLQLISSRPGWVEQDPRAVLESVQSALIDLSRHVELDSAVCLGISNQRESLLLWERVSGNPVSPVISWQDRRTINLVQELSWAADEVRSISGLPLDPMFSAVKARWILDEYDPDRVRSMAGELVLGTIDSWLLFSLTGEVGIECGNASRTSLVDLSTGDWSPRLLEIFAIPRLVLPEIRDSVGIVGTVSNFAPLAPGLPVTGILGDSHAALFAHAGWRPGVAKATYGTGSSVMALGDSTWVGDTGLCRTIAWRMPTCTPAIAWEANILAAGATVAWLAEILGCSSAELADEADSSSEGVVIVPAFNGLAAPWWDTRAQAVISGLSLSTGRAQLARAVLDSVVFQVCDVIAAMRDAQCLPVRLIADGGISANSDVMRRQAALCELVVAVSPVADASALGAAHAAGLGCGFWDLAALEALPREYVEFTDSISPELRSSLLHEWHQALALAQSR